MASPNLSEIVTTTLRNRSGKLADNVSNSNALLHHLRKKGNVKPVSGGRTIVQELEYAENSTFIRYSGYDQLNVSASDVFTAAEFSPAQAAVAISISGLEQIMNAGEEQKIDLLESRIKNAERTMANNIASDAYSDGSADGGKQIGGLQLLVSKTPTSGTVGGIDRSAFSFWQNQYYGPSGAPTSSTIQGRMNYMANRLVRGRDGTNLIVMDVNYYNTYQESLQTIQRITKSESAGAGFTSLSYFGGGREVDVVLDDVGPTNTAYFINTNYLFFRPYAARNFTPIGGDRESVNQDAMVKLIGFAGNMTMSNASLQGVLFHS